MVSFHLKKKLLVTVFIIVIMWLLIKSVIYLFSVFQSDDSSSIQADLEGAPYVEKIDNFALQEFDTNQKITHFITAKQYLRFKDAPALLLQPKIIIYDEKGKQIYSLDAINAHYLDNGEVKFIGRVNIHSNTGADYVMNTQALILAAKTYNLTSNKKVTYLGEDTKIVAQGMLMQAKQDKMKLLGKTSIHQDSGQKILTKDLIIDKSNKQQHYYSEHDTTYLSKASKIYAQGIDMDLQRKIIKLLDKVEILQNSGSKINTKNLTIDQSNGNEIYRTKEQIHYQSKLAYINAKSMQYDAKRQKIKLTDGVTGHYE